MVIQKIKHLNINMFKLNTLPSNVNLDNVIGSQIIHLIIKNYQNF